MKKQLFFKRDSFLATVFVFLIMTGCYLIAINFHLFSPLKVALKDFSFNDLAFTDNRLNSAKDDRIVIINIDTAGRKTIANLVSRIHQYQPKVIGLDIVFAPKEDEANAELDAVLHTTPELVLSQAVDTDDESDTVSYRPSMFTEGHAAGYVNFRNAEGGVIRYYPAFIKDKERTLESFSSAIVRMADSAAYAKLKKRNKPNEYINYRRAEKGYYMYDYTDVLESRMDSSFLKDKIVLLGYIASSPYSIEDKHFTPLNEKFFGRSVPDMNGIVIHANIISMVLDKDYIVKVPGWLLMIAAFFITWWYMRFLIDKFLHHHMWFHLIAKTLELLLGVLLVYVAVLVLRVFSISIDFSSILFAIVVSVDALYFYEAIRNWLHKKYGIPSIFIHEH